MATVVCNVSALAVASIFYTWRTYYFKHVLQQQQQQLRKRVAYMLWVMANRGD